MNKNISIILWTYNESASIQNTIDELIKYIKDVEIIVVDDNSPDGTFEILKKINYSKLIIDTQIMVRFELSLTTKSGTTAR